MEQLSFVYVFFCLSLCLVVQTSGLYSKESVPVLIWSNERQPLDTPAVSAIPISFSHVEGKYLKAFNQNNILLFLQDTLSVEDLSSHEGIFNHVSKYMENGHSLYLPAVEIGTSLSHAFSAHGYNIITLEPGSAIGELKLKQGSPNLVLVKLPSTTTNPSRQKALQKTDEIIGNVISKIGKLAEFTVIYTGVEPSMKLESRVEHRRTARAIRPRAEEDAKFFYTSCVILYMWNDFQVQKGNHTYWLFSNSTTEPTSDCQDLTEKLNINYKDVGDNHKVKLSIHFARNNRYWTVRYADITEMPKEGPSTIVTLDPRYQMEYIPVNKSYACSKKLTFVSNTTDEIGVPVYKLIVQGMQVQAFSGGQKTFDDSWDCVGFFTIPIWMGLFAGILFTFILLIGMFMLVDIKTMDRFDDPKGKHFVIAGASE